MEEGQDGKNPVFFCYIAMDTVRYASDAFYRIW